ncbi:MAG TPA: diacylglycerol kinase family protein [Vicinamibacterales bacterium]|nr:diacylglycerol kinase family protein [Vicinamibacterales bacterium]
MRIAIIINPRSGLAKSHRTAAGTRVECAARWAASMGVTAEVEVTTHAGHAAELAAGFLATGVDRVVAWGGDGTVNETAGPLLGSRVAFGIVPGGSGDGLARSLGLPRDYEAAMRVALTAVPRPMDAAWLAGRHFLNIAGIGFDAEIAERFSLRQTRGTRGYVAESLRSVWTYACEGYRISVRGEPTARPMEFNGPHFVIAFANGREYGSGLAIAPEADPSDGWLDAVIVKGGSPLRQLWRSRRLGWRPMSPAEGVWRGRVREASITGARLVCHVDGEPFETSGEVSVRLDHGALLVAGLR